MIALVKIPIEFLITSAGEKKKLYASIDLDYHSKIRITIRGYDERYYREREKIKQRKKNKKILDVYARVYSINDLRNKLFLDAICIFK